MSLTREKAAEYLNRQDSKKHRRIIHQLDRLEPLTIESILIVSALRSVFKETDQDTSYADEELLKIKQAGGDIKGSLNKFLVAKKTKALMEKGKITKEKIDAAVAAAKEKAQQEGALQEVRLLTIGDHDPKVSIPVLLQTLLDIKSKLPEPLESAANNNNEQGSAAATLKLIGDAGKILAENDEMQNTWGPFLLKYIKNLNKDTIVNGLTAIVAGADEIVVTPATLLLWEECALWFEGLYRRTYDNIRKYPAGHELHGQPFKENGRYVTCDKLDSLFNGIVGLTKMDISDFYHAAAQKINQKVEQYKLQHKSQADLKAVLEVEAELSDVVEEVVSGQIVEERTEQKLSLHIEFPADRPDLMERMRELAERFLQNPEADGILIPQPSRSPEPKLDNQLVTMLNLVADESEDVKLTALEIATEQYELTGPQAGVLKTLAQDAIAQLDSYIHRNKIQDYLWSPTHKKLAEKVRENLKQPYQEPKDYLGELYHLRKELIGKCSDDLLTKVNKVLLGAFTMLCKMKFDDKARLSMPVLRAMK